MLKDYAVIIDITKRSAILDSILVIMYYLSKRLENKCFKEAESHFQATIELISNGLLLTSDSTFTLLMLTN